MTEHNASDAENGGKHAHASSHEHHPHHHLPSDPELRVRALETLLVEKGLVDPAALDAIIDAYETRIGPRNGAQVVARAWTDPAYLERLRTDANAAIREMGLAAAKASIW